MAFGMKSVIRQPYPVVVDRVRAALEAEGVVVVHIHDVAAAFEESFGLTIPPQVALGVCTPALALAALRADPSVGLLVPCSIVIRVDGDMTVVEAPKLHMVVAITGDPALEPAVADASARVRAVLSHLETLLLPPPTKADDL